MLKNNKYYFSLTKSNKVQMIYRTIIVKYNDGTEKVTLQYRSSFNIWKPSCRNQYKNPLEDLQEITEQELNQFLKL